MHIFSVLFVLFSLLSRVLADVSITSPGIGQSFSASGGDVTVTVKWDDDSDSSSDDASLENVQKYAIVLLTGSNTDIKSVQSLTTSLAKSEKSYEAKISASEVPNGIYFIQVYSTFKSGYTIHYTPRFTLKGMTGDVADFTMKPSAFSITGDAPSAQILVGGAAAPTSLDSKSFKVPYTEQTGRTRYAPMQTQPGPSISYSKFSTRHLTSAYTPYESLSPSPNVYSTITAGWDYTPKSLVNSAPVANDPSHYYPASQRVVATPFTKANKKRWL